MKRIVIVTTGGTIAMTHAEAAGGAIPVLTGSDLSNALPRDLAEIQTEEFSNLPSAHFTVDHLWNLSRRVTAVLQRNDVDGIVVTHGTDVLEESAYLCDITVNSPKPIVFTGAMRTASDPGYEGIANLVASIKTAICNDLINCGTLVVMNDEIHAARDVTKTHTTAIETFLSPEFGPIGRVYTDHAIVARKPLVREFIPATHLDDNVHLLKVGIGMSEKILDSIGDHGSSSGIVIEGLGGGRVPPWWLPSIEKAIRQGILVVITSRVGSGRTIDRYGYSGAHRDLANIGCLFSDGLNGQKTRIKLMAALGTNQPAKYFAHGA